ncbi:hypothetical protein H8F21_13305 [Pseudomonas sp. P66]|uniref:Uncharacterized protein n=1 Tax=Pseudomonas arcuscaelestis TaxID=2710591 RepID=A0ABS2BYM6_9PSED|nr:hypothetical protein [Pseudomonas arcuscaelestis]MBM5458540.1 hypothetical protein [Pseudomonas arcuscaelestis]
MERIEAEGERLCAAFGLKLDHAVSFSEDAIRIYGNDLANIQAAGAAMADFLSAQDGLRFVEVAEDGV